MTHGSFSKIGMSPEFQRTFLREQIQDYEILLTDMQGTISDDAGKSLIKQISRNSIWRGRTADDSNAKFITYHAAHS